MLERRYRTLLRGLDFLDREAGDGDADLSRDLVRTRLLGNRLRELDRFLNLLADEAAARLGGADHDRAAFARLTNTANKIRAVRAMMALDSPDHEPLRAVGRLANCLHHCGGRVHAPGEWTALASGGGAAVAISADGTGRLAVSRAVLRRICRLYRKTAGDLLAGIDRLQPLRIDFPAIGAHMSMANVACDGI